MEKQGNSKAPCINGQNANGALLAPLGAAMVPRLCAAWLVLLIVLPFSAPFSTCDLATLFGGTENPLARHTAGPLASSRSLDHDVATHAPSYSRLKLRDRAETPLSVYSLTIAANAGSRVHHRVTRPTRVSDPILTPLRI